MRPVIRSAFLIACSLCFLSAAATVRAEPIDPAVQATYTDIQKTFGRVPNFIKKIPPEVIVGLWEEDKSLFLNPKTVLSAKDKDLIGLSVASQVPCRYCVFFHTESAKVGGASDKEIAEAVGLASETRHWSTVLNGLQTDMPKFREEMSKVFDNLKQKKDTRASMGTPAPVVLTNAASVYTDVQNTFGLVPTFIKEFPEISVVGAWKALKMMQLSPNTLLSPKVKELMGVAVAAQIPCTYCSFFHSEAAKMNGANETEIKEAVAIAAMVRQWSTLMNGLDVDEMQFRKEVKEIMAFVAKTAAATPPHKAP